MWWLYLVVFGSVVAFVAYMVLLSSTGPALATSYTFVNPVIAMLLGKSTGKSGDRRDRRGAAAQVDQQPTDYYPLRTRGVPRSGALSALHPILNVRILEKSLSIGPMQ